MTVRLNLARVALAAVLMGGFAGTARAEVVTYNQAADWYDVSELSFGVGATDPTMQKELSADATAELLLVPVGNIDWPRVLRFRPDFGINADLEGRTSYAYAGMTFDFLNFHQFFVDGSLDMAIHDGHLHGDASHRALGSREEFRESAQFGYQFDRNWAFQVYIDHLSNAGLFSSINQGIETAGIRVSYLFNKSTCCSLSWR